MYSQLQKLAIICNICFWCTVFFQVWEQSRAIPELVLNTILVLGVLALLVNLITAFSAVFYFRKLANHIKMKPWLEWFIGFSAICQVIWLGYNLNIYFE